MEKVKFNFDEINIGSMYGRVFPNMEYRGAHRMGASLQHVKQNLFLNFFDYIGKNILRGWAILVLAALDLSSRTACTGTAQPLDVFLPM